MGSVVPRSGMQTLCPVPLCQEMTTELRNIKPDGFHQLYAVAGGDHAGTETIVKGKPVLLKAFLEVNIANLRGENLFQRSKSKVVGCDKTDSAIANQCAQHALRAHAPIM